MILLPSRAQAQVRAPCSDSVDALPQTFTSVVLTDAILQRIMASSPRRSALSPKISSFLAMIRSSYECLACFLRAGLEVAARSLGSDIERAL